MAGSDDWDGWRDQCALIASRFLQGRIAPSATAQFDQFLAETREAGLTEREQGVVLAMKVLKSVDDEPWATRLTEGSRRIVATAIAVELLSRNE